FFLVEHSVTATAHPGEVKKIITEFCTTPELEGGAIACLEVSLHLTGLILEGVYREYRRGLPAAAAMTKDPTSEAGDGRATPVAAGAWTAAAWRRSSGPRVRAPDRL